MDDTKQLISDYVTDLLKDNRPDISPLQRKVIGARVAAQYLKELPVRAPNGQQTSNVIPIRSS